MGHVPQDTHWDDGESETKRGRIYRRIRQFLSLTALAFIVILSIFLAWISDHYVVPILMYHNVGSTGKSEPNWVTPEHFNNQMAFLEEHGYKVVSLDQLVDTINKKTPLSRKMVVITFDDGAENVYQNAFPILKKYNFPATIFVISDFVNKPGFLTEGQLKEMMQYRIDVGSHSKTHRYLPDLPYEEQRDEIIESKRSLEKQLGIEVRYFAYPVGGFTEDIKSVMKSVGYKAACTTNRGQFEPQEDLYELKRIRFSDSDDQDFPTWVKLSGYYNFFRQFKTPGGKATSTCLKKE